MIVRSRPGNPRSQPMPEVDSFLHRCYSLAR